MKFEDVVASVMCLKDLYISGRMNLNIADTIADCEHFGKENLEEYTALAQDHLNGSVDTLIQMYKDGDLTQLDDEILYLVTDSSYEDFDDELMNDMVTDFYGSKDSVGFASSYNYFGEDFNNLLSEFIETSDD